VRAWHKPTSGVDLYVEGKKIGRAARLAFLSREVSPAYAVALQTDRDLLQSTFYRLNAATHDLEAPFTALEADLLLSRVSFLIHILLRLAGH